MGFSSVISSLSTSSFPKGRASHVNACGH
jgi:hypothetical protein